MTNFLANEAATGGGFDWSILATPAGVILGTLITGLIALRNARKSVYERLESLAKTRKEWPAGLEGTETIEKSIALALAEIRKREKHEVLAVTPAEQQANLEISQRWTRDQRVAALGVVVAIVATVFTALAAAMSEPQASAQGSSAWSSIAVTVITIIAVAIGAFSLFRNR